MAASADTVLELLAQVAHSGLHRGGVILPNASGKKELTWQEVAALACRAADGLASLGVACGDRVALAIGNSLDWIVADFAVQMLGGVVVPLHVSLSGRQLAWQLAHSDSRLLIVSGQEICDRLSATETLSAELQMVSISQALDPRQGQPLLLWPELIAGGHEAAGRARWKATQATASPSTLASIVYTSGTSGEPRGVMLTQGNLAANAQATATSFRGNQDDCRLNVLPFSHAFGRMSDLYVSLATNTRLALCQTRETLVADAPQVQPTLLVVVPLLLARLRQAAVAKFGADDPAAVKKLLGGKVRGFICGGAALTGELRDYFSAQQTPVWEGYGLTETSPVVSASSPSASKPNSVGQVVPGMMAQIADDGELLVSGPQVMAGYWKDETATREVLRNGWLHTGDLAEIDAAGFLYLKGRKREFLALTSGKKVWPAKIEGQLAGDAAIEQIMVVGEGERCLGALIVPRERAPGVDVDTSARREWMLAHLAERLEGYAQHEQIRRVRLLSEAWSAEREELTPKLTLRRNVIAARYAGQIRQMFLEDVVPRP
jgi:long-chain acyl-CoA synthetase